MQQPDWIKEVAAKIDLAAQAEVASEAASVGAGDLSAALKMFGAMVVMDREADAQRCARLVGSMPPVQCKDTGRIYHPRSVFPPPAAPVPTMPQTSLPTPTLPPPPPMVSPPPLPEELQLSGVGRTQSMEL